MEANNNLPALNREINLFTSDKNVDKKIVSEIEAVINQMKSVKIKGDVKDLNVRITKHIYKIPIDTFSYLITMYPFYSVTVQSDYDNKLRLYTKYQIDDCKTLYIYSESIQLNLLPPDITKLINS